MGWVEFEHVSCNIHIHVSKAPTTGNRLQCKFLPQNSQIFLLNWHTSVHLYSYDYTEMILSKATKNLLFPKHKGILLDALDNFHLENLSSWGFGNLFWYYFLLCWLFHQLFCWLPFPKWSWSISMPLESLQLSFLPLHTLPEKTIYAHGFNWYPGLIILKH